MMISVLLSSLLLLGSRWGSQVGVSALDAQENLSEHTYGVIVDCGSSGTRANIYGWNSYLEYPQLLHDIEPLRDKDGQPVRKKIKPGLSSLADEPEKASDYMRPLIEFISDNIPGESLSSAGIYFMCTAGMRLLNADTQLSILRDVATDVKMNYNFAKVDTSVISGAREGIYQWITVNSRLKRFDMSTYGVMEMGGASTQITYQLLPGMYESISESLANDPEALKSFQNQVVEPQMSREATEHNFRIFSTSFLGFGSNSVRELFVDLLVMYSQRARYRETHRRITAHRFGRGPRKLRLDDPCLPLGSTQKMNKPIRMLSALNQTIGFVADDDEPSFEVSLIGKGDFYKCHMLAYAMLQLAKQERLNCEPGEPCPMSLLGTPFVPYQQKFVALSDFYYTTNEVMDLAGTFDRKSVRSATEEICSMSYEQLVKLHPEANRNDPDRILLECFKAVWIDTFLSSGTKMPDDNHSVETIGKIKGESIDWTLGAVLDKSLAIEEAAEDANSPK